MKTSIVPTGSFRRPLLLASTLLAAIPSLAAAANDGASSEGLVIVNKEALAKDVFKFDYGVPASPALTLLGVAPDKVAQSNSLKPFVFALPQLFGSEKEGDALALDVAPGWLIVPAPTRTNKKYTDGSRLRRIALRTRAAIAAFEGQSGGADASKALGSRVTAGFSTSLLDSSDPLLARLPTDSDDSPSGRKSAWVVCLDAAGTQIDSLMSAQLSAPSVPMRKLTDARDTLIREREAIEAKRDAPGNSAAQVTEFETQIEQKQLLIDTVQGEIDATSGAAKNELQDRIKDSATSKLIAGCVEKADLAARMGTDLDFGFGAVRRGEPAKFSHLRDGGWVSWASYRRAIHFGFGQDGELSSWTMIGLSARAGFDEFISTQDKTTPEIRGDAFNGWVGIERYSRSNRFTLQVGEERLDPKTGTPAGFDKSRFRYMATFVQRLGGPDASLWLSLAYGNANGAGAAKDDRTVQLTLLFSPPDAARIFGGP